MEALDHLLQSYAKEKPSSRPYLDARYFNLVLEGYTGLVEKAIKIHITEEEMRVSGNGEWKQRFLIQEQSAPFTIKNNENSLIRVVIEYERIREGRPSKVARHSNLLVLSNEVNSQGEQLVYRFEPIANHKYQHQITEVLSEIVASFGTAPYHLVELAEHPQSLLTSNMLGGMCLAYVLKLAVMYVTGNELVFSDREEDIRSFAAAVEKHYAIALEARYGADSLPDIEYGATATIVGATGGAFLGGAAFGLTGVLLGGIGGGLLGNELSKNREERSKRQTSAR